MARVCEACKRKELCATYKDAKAFYTDLENFGCMHFRLGKPTNADRIRTMTNEELAELFADNDCGYCRIHDFCFARGCQINCEDAWLKWLNEEVSE